MLALIDEAPWEDGGGGPPSNRILGCQLRLKKLWLTVVVVYLVSGAGLSSHNLSILNTIKMIVMAVPGPVIVMGDFNLIMAEMVEGGIIDERMIPVFDVTFPTTISGANRRCIDHMLVPPGLRKAIVSANRILHQWRPHLGFHVAMKKSF